MNRWLLSTAAALLSALTFALAWDGQFDLPLLFAWAASVALWWAALRPAGAGQPDMAGFFRRGASAYAPRSRQIHRSAPTDAVETPYETAGGNHRRRRGLPCPYALILMIVGAGVLLFRLNDLPYDMMSDHGAYLRDAIRVSEGARDIYFSDNSGREPILMYAAAGIAPLFGFSYLTLKLISAAAALLTLPALYFIGRDLDGRSTGLLALALGVFCTWHLLAGRIGFRVTLASLAAAWLTWALWRALHSGRRSHFLLAGVILGAGLYGYTSFRIAPLLVVLGVGVAWLARTTGDDGRTTGDDEQTTQASSLQYSRALLANAAALAVIAAAVFMPLLSYMLHYPDLFWWRVNAYTSDTSAWSPLALLQSLLDSFLMFFTGRDQIFPNLIAPGTAVLTPPLALLFGAGCFVWIGRIIRRRDPWLLFVPLALLIWLLPSALGVSIPEETPSARRGITALPLVVLLAGVGLNAIIGWIAAMRRTDAPRAAALIGGALLALHIGVSLYMYFVIYPENASPGSNRDIAANFHEFIAEGGSVDNTFVVSDGEWLDKSLIGLWLGEPDWTNIITVQIDAAVCERLRAQRRAGGPLMIQVMASAETMADLIACFPVHDSYGYMAHDGAVLNVLLVP